MKVIASFLTLLLVVNAFSDQEQWVSFKNEHGKIYRSSREESTRFAIFQENLRKIEAHNAKYEKGEETYMMGVNQFTDLTLQEFTNLYTMRNTQPVQRSSVYYAEPNIEAATSVDWRSKAVTDVGNQGSCGSCWTFSSVGALEGQYAIKHKQKTALSPQELLDCSGPNGTDGCNGGWMNDAFRYVKDHGIGTLADYPYHAVKQNCKNSTVRRTPLKVTGYKFVDKKEEAIRQAVEHIGPLSISMNHVALVSYSTGILNPPNCPDNTTHAVLLVGYGTENGLGYWIVKNSWGTKWGENGYFRIVRKGTSPCGILNHALFPVID